VLFSAETKQFRQAKWIEFTKRNHMLDHCGSKPGFERVIACFMEKLMMDDNSCSTTVPRHANTINKVFQLLNFKPPTNLSDQTNMCMRITFAQEKEEHITRQQSPITREMFSGLLELAKNPPPNSLEANAADWMIFVRITGLCCSKYAQKTQSVVNKYIYPSSKSVVKAFLPTDWKFCNHNNATINIHPSKSEI
jgi:hypothetical protein